MYTIIFTFLRCIHVVYMIINIPCLLELIDTHMMVQGSVTDIMFTQFPRVIFCFGGGGGGVMWEGWSRTAVCYNSFFVYFFRYFAF